MKRTTAVGALGATLLIAALFAAPAQAGPWVSAPSSDLVDGAVTVEGGGVAPNGQVMLSVLDASGTVVGTYVADVDAEGRFSYDVPLAPSENAYLLEVWDVAGSSELPLTEAQLVAGSGQ